MTSFSPQTCLREGRTAGLSLPAAAMTTGSAASLGLVIHLDDGANLGRAQATSPRGQSTIGCPALRCNWCGPWCLRTGRTTASLELRRQQKTEKTMLGTKRLSVLPPDLTLRKAKKSASDRWRLWCWQLGSLPGPSEQVWFSKEPCNCGKSCTGLLLIRL